MTIGDFFLKYYFSLISIGKIVLEVIIIFVIVTSLLIFASEKIAKFPYNFYSIETGSMKPELPPGTLIITQRSKDYAVDEIITFKYQDVKKPLTHRIININKDGQYITKGDNNQIDDIHPVPNTDIIGKVVF